MLCAIIVFGQPLALPALAQSDAERFVGVWHCRVSSAKLIDVEDLRRQIETSAGIKLPDAQWNTIKSVLTSTHDEELKELMSTPFSFEISGLGSSAKAVVTAADSSRNESVSANYVNGEYTFNFKRFLGPAQANIVTRVKENIGVLKGSTVGESVIDMDGMKITIRSSIVFDGVMRDPKKPPSGVEIVDAKGNSLYSATMAAGSRASFNYIISPADYDPAQIKKVEWYTNDTKVITVDGKGSVTAIAPGKTQLAVWLNNDFALTDTIDITVVPAGTLPEPVPEEPSLPEEKPSKPPGESGGAKPADAKKPDGDERADGLLDKIESAAAETAETFSATYDYLPKPEYLKKVPLVDILLFGYGVDSDRRGFVEMGDSQEFANQKAFWGNVMGLGPIGAVPKTMDLVLFAVKKAGLDFEFSFEQTVKGLSNYFFDEFSSQSHVDTQTMRRRNKENHYGFLGGFGAWLSSTISDVASWGKGVSRAIDSDK